MEKKINTLKIQYCFKLVIISKNKIKKEKGDFLYLKRQCRVSIVDSRCCGVPTINNTKGVT